MLHEPLIKKSVSVLSEVSIVVSAVGVTANANAFITVVINVVAVVGAIWTCCWKR